ncbi:MAG: MBL fold metallo-hydrolase [Pseudomonadales bacterium]
MATTFKKGLQDLGNGIYAYLQPDGSWGWSNAGLVVDGDQSLLVDTLFDEKLTAEMLSTMTDIAGPKAECINWLVNTHANGDHCHGNHLVSNAEIIASSTAAREMDDLTPEMMAELMRAASGLGDLGEYLIHCFGAFDFEQITHTPPTQTFDGEKTLKVGDKTVQLIEVGPAHTGGDVLAWVPDDRTVFTGDILFIDGTPIIWAGPVSNWIAACDRILQMDAEHIVPGHGPITDKKGVQAVASYLQHIEQQARIRFDGGMALAEAVHDIPLNEFADWLDPERIAINVATLYREFSGEKSQGDPIQTLTLAAEVWKRSLKK